MTSTKGFLFAASVYIGFIFENAVDMIIVTAMALAVSFFNKLFFFHGILPPFVCRKGSALRQQTFSAIYKFVPTHIITGKKVKCCRLNHK